MSKKRIILMIITSILFVLALIGVYFFTQNNEELNVTGKVIINGEDYVIIESNNEDYLVNEVANNYNVGDEVTFTYKKGSLKDNTSPKEITAIKEELIKENEYPVQDEHKKEEDQPNNNQNETTQNSSSNNQNSTNNNSNNANNSTNNTENNEINSNNTTNNSNNSVTPKTADEEVLAYVNQIEEDANNGITNTLKSGFITVVDFLFYNGEIAGHTFNELTTKAKLEVLKAALWIDDKIDHVFPGYKETISNGASKVYTSVKNLIVSTYLDITTSICENHSDLCISAKEDFQDLKQSFGFTWDFIKDLASSGLDKLKNWYEIWSGK